MSAKNPFLDHRSEGSERIIAPTDKAERQAFWIARGNQLLDQHGKQHLEWVCKDGFYFIGDPA